MRPLRPQALLQQAKQWQTGAQQATPTHLKCAMAKSNDVAIPQVRHLRLYPDNYLCGSLQIV